MDLIVDTLSCARGGLPVLEGVSFRVPAGQLLELRGPNGIGKTTLLRTLAGLQPALSGTVEPGAEALAYGSHADAVKAALTVKENLRFWAAVYGGGDVAEAMAALNLEALAERPGGTLSAGQKRRLGLARLMLTGRSIWLLDEPTVSLDAASVALFKAVITAHLARGGAALAASHIPLGEAALDLTTFRAALPEIGFDEAFL